MAKENSLLDRLYCLPHLSQLAKVVGYTGFPVRELAERTKALRANHSVSLIAEALRELVTFTGNRVLLNAQVRDYCWQLLGPPPEAWDRFYRNADGTPTPRPPGRERVPVIPERELDPITDQLRMLTVTDLVEKLTKARSIRAEKGNTSHLADNALETIACVESELVRRGMAIPEDPAFNAEPELKPKNKSKPKKQVRKQS